MYTVVHGDIASRHRRRPPRTRRLARCTRANQPPRSAPIPTHHAGAAARPERHPPSRPAPPKTPRSPKGPRRRRPLRNSPARTAPRRRPGTPSWPRVTASVGTGYHVAGSHWSKGYHTGVDFAVPTGTSREGGGGRAGGDRGLGGSYGYQVVLRHADGRYTQYAHLSAISVRVGQSVTAGQRIGRSGATGNVTGPHLHFSEVRTGPGFARTSTRSRLPPGRRRQDLTRLPRRPSTGSSTGTPAGSGCPTWEHGAGRCAGTPGVRPAPGRPGTSSARGTGRARPDAAGPLRAGTRGTALPRHAKRAGTAARGACSAAVGPPARRPAHRKGRTPSVTGRTAGDGPTGDTSGAVGAAGEGQPVSGQSVTQPTRRHPARPRPPIRPVRRWPAPAVRSSRSVVTADQTARRHHPRRPASRVPVVPWRNVLAEHQGCRRRWPAPGLTTVSVASGVESPPPRYAAWG